MAFKVVKKLDLSDLGEDWNGCYLEFYALSFDEAKDMAGLDRDDPVKAADEALKVLQKHLVGGKAVGLDGKQVEVAAKDLADFPVEVIVKAINLLVGEVSPNA